MNPIAKSMSVIVILALAFSIVFTEKAISDNESAWGNLPPLELQSCIKLSQKIEANITTPIRNDYVVVTAYEEKPEETMEVDESRRYLNLYLVGGLFVLPGRMGVYFNNQVVVNKLVYDAESDTKTAYKWILADGDRDGIVEDAVLHTVVKDSKNQVLSFDAVSMPNEEVGAVQSYYEHAITLMREKRDYDMGHVCIAT
jgi:ADP-glucose pyrophosphorylase